MAQVSSYVPEYEFYRGKDWYSPIFWEDLAVLDVRDSGRVLACREAHIKPPKSNFQNADTVKKILEFAKAVQNGRNLFSVGKKTVLIFGDALAATGIAVVAVLPERIEKVVHGLRRLGRKDFPLPPPKTREPELTQEQMNGLVSLFFHVESLFSKGKEIKRMTQILRIADFAGCRVDFANLVPERLKLQDEDEQRLRLFLLCVFLKLRLRMGKVSLKESEEEDVLYVKIGERNLATTFLEKEEQPKTENGITGSKAFEAFRISENEKGLTAEAELRAATYFAKTVNSGFERPRVQLYFSFSIRPKEHLEPIEIPPFII